MTDAHLIVQKTEAHAAPAVWRGTARQLQQLVDAAAGGRAAGMNALAGSCYGSADWLLVRVAVHESGHAVVAELHGIAAEIKIEGGARLGNGHCVLDPAVRTASRHARRMIGLSGQVAAQIAEFGHAATAAWAHRNLTWPETASPSDLEMAGGFSASDTAACCELVRRRWPAIAARARNVLDAALRANGQRGLQ